MRRPLLKLVLFALAWPASVMMAISAYEIFLEFTKPVGRQPPNLERIQHPQHHPVAQRALQQFSRLSVSRRAAIKSNLRSVITDVDTWALRLQNLKSWVLCIGEQHDEHTRYFLAKKFLPKLSLQTMMLETTPDGLAEIENHILQGDGYVPLLKADISEIMRIYWARDPGFIYHGIEETVQQKKIRDKTATGSRDQNIAINALPGFQKGGRSVILIGALHCRDDPGWLFSYLRQAMAQAPDKGDLINVRVVGEHQDGPLEAFVYFLDEIGLNPGDFSIAKADKLDPWIWKAFALFADQSFKPYKNTIVFRFEDTVFKK